jgi:hypothetical protein
MPQLVIDRLQEEIVRLKARWRYQERTAQEGPFGSSTPSAKGPLKTNAPPENPQCRGGMPNPATVVMVTAAFPTRTLRVRNRCRD